MLTETKPKTEKPKAEEKPKGAEKPAAKEPKAEVKTEAKIEDMTPEQQEEMLREEPPPEGYAKAPVVSVPVEEPPAEAGKPEEKPAAEAKPGEKPAEKPAETGKEDFFLRLERESAKPEGQEDLKDFTDRERAYFYQMRRDRKARQKAEEERDGLRFNEIKRKKQEEKQALEKDPLDTLKKKDQTDFMTVGEVIELVEKIQKPKVEEKPAEKQADSATDPVQLNYLKLCEKEARSAHADDFDAVMELIPELIDGNEKVLPVIARRMQAGENPAEVMYELIKQDPEFAKLFPAAQTRVEARTKAKAPAAPKAEEPAKPAEKTAEEIAKENQARKAQEALEANNNRPKTTGHAAGGEDKPAGELSMEEVTQMSDMEFRKLPKATRDRYLRIYG